MASAEGLRDGAVFDCPRRETTVMKNLYWRPHRTPKAALLVIAILAVAGMSAVELFPTETVQPYYEEKLAAANLADQGM